MYNSNHHSSLKCIYIYIYVYKSTIYCTMLYYFKTKYTYIKKNIRGIRIKSVVYLDFEMQQKISDHLSS